MKNQTIIDERVLLQKRKIGSDGFQILLIGLLASILIQQYIFDAPFSQYAVEYAFFICSSFYVLLRNLMVGNNIFSSNKSSKNLVVVNSIVCGLTITVINTVLNYIKLGDLFITDIGNTIMLSGITFVCATVGAFIIFEMLYLINKKKQEKIESMLNDDEDINE
jgi:TctA family transporter